MNSREQNQPPKKRERGEAQAREVGWFLLLRVRRELLISFAFNARLLISFAFNARANLAARLGDKLLGMPVRGVSLARLEASLFIHGMSLVFRFLSGFL